LRTRAVQRARNEAPSRVDHGNNFSSLRIFVLGEVAAIDPAVPRAHPLDASVCYGDRCGHLQCDSMITVRR
jgi:hypothetical protein